MKKTHYILFSLSFILLTGCSSMFVPGNDELSQLPVVKMGSLKPAGNEYILHIPAGTKIPVNLSIDGNLISGKVDNNSSTRLNKELYVYKYWASLDGKKWQPTRDLVHMPISIGVGPDGGQIKIAVDLKK